MSPWPLDYKWPFFAYLAGLIFYITRIPEKWSPNGKFDMLGASHQIFHVLVLAGIALTFNANINLYEKRLQF